MIWDEARVIIIEIKCTINVMHLNHPKTIPFHPGPWKNCLPQNWAAAQRTGDHCSSRKGMYALLCCDLKAVTPRGSQRAGGRSASCVPLLGSYMWLKASRATIGVLQALICIQASHCASALFSLWKPLLLLLAPLPPPLETHLLLLDPPPHHPTRNNLSHLCVTSSKFQISS